MIKIIRRTTEIALTIGLTAFLYDTKISISDNVVLMIPLFFIYGLMYLFIKKNK
jgi:hypothetical protein